MNRNKINTAAILASLLAMQYSQSNATAYTWKGNHYPINNKKGFAAKDKRGRK